MSRAEMEGEMAARCEGQVLAAALPWLCGAGRLHGGALPLCVWIHVLAALVSGSWRELHRIPASRCLSCGCGTRLSWLRDSPRETSHRGAVKLVEQLSCLKPREQKSKAPVPFCPLKARDSVASQKQMACYFCVLSFYYCRSGRELQLLQ